MNNILFIDYNKLIDFVRNVDTVYFEGHGSMHQNYDSGDEDLVMSAMAFEFQTLLNQYKAVVISDKI